jgi:UDP-3-O-[3-hydroxymyristoyl] glucosamine N-acyltransferase
MTSPLTLGKVAELTGGALRGDGDVQIHRVATLPLATTGDLTWAASPKFAEALGTTAATAAIVCPELERDDLPTIVTDRPDLAISKVLTALQPPLPHPLTGIHPAAIIDDNASLGDGVAIGPHVVVQAGASIGARTILHSGVTVYADSVVGQDCVLWSNVVIRERCKIGNRVLIHPNSTIGADGFGFNFVDGYFEKIPQIGVVSIGDDVEIGANCCIDRAKCGETRIQRGCKIDNLSQIGHNVQIGEHTCLAAQAGIAGSVTIGHHVLFGGKVGVRDHTTIGNGAKAAGCACIGNDVPDETLVAGAPAVQKMDYFRQVSAITKLPDALRLVRQLVKRIERLESAND